MKKQIEQILKEKTCNLFAGEWYEATSFELASLIGEKKPFIFEVGVRYCLNKEYLNNGNKSISKKMFTMQIQKWAKINGLKFEFNRTHESRGFILKK